MVRFVGCAVAAALVLACGGPAAAQSFQLNFEFADAAGVPQSVFTIPTVGGTLPIRVYLRESTAGAPVLNAQGGLGSSGVRVTFDSPAGVAEVQNPATSAVGAIPPWNDYTTNGSNSTSAVLNLLSPFESGVLPDAGGRIFLGTFTFTGLSQGSVTIGATDPNPLSNFDTTHYDDLAGLDNLIGSGTATVVVAPVPEPGGVLLVGAAVLGAWRLGFRRRSSAGGGD